MNPEFLMVNDMPKVRATIQLGKLRAVQRASRKVNEWTGIIEQNIGYCEESPAMAALGRGDALTAAKELAKAAKELLQTVKDLNDDNQ